MTGSDGYISLSPLYSLCPPLRVDILRSFYLPFTFSSGSVFVLSCGLGPSGCFKGTAFSPLLLLCPTEPGLLPHFRGLLHHKYAVEYILKRWAPLISSRCKLEEAECVRDRVVSGGNIFACNWYEALLNESEISRSSIELQELAFEREKGACTTTAVFRRVSFVHYERACYFFATLKYRAHSVM